MADRATIQQAAARSAEAAHRSVLAGISPRYYVCVAILIASALAMRSTAAALGRHFSKQPLPLKKSLYLLDKSRLAPRYELAPIQPPPLTDEIVQNLGTTEYLDWHIVDKSVDRSSALYRARLFVTYYTGQPDLVPHNPKECLSAAGYTLARETLANVEVPLPGRAAAHIPVSVLEFETPQRSRFVAGDGSGAAPRLTVAYFFLANGTYVTTRDEVRVRTSSLFDRYAYYSKIELSFTDAAGAKLATRDQTIEAIRPLLGKLMPVLLSEHYQEWEAIRTGQPPASPNP
ncbi:MAG: hypothetical protein HRF50_01415 [Phycisphaerae bacterium]|jgi:hypothetical protein